MFKLSKNIPIDKRSYLRCCYTRTARIFALGRGSPSPVTDGGANAGDA